MKKKIILGIVCLVVVIAVGLWYGNSNSKKSDNHKNELESQEVIDDSKNTNNETQISDNTSEFYNGSFKEGIELPIDVIESEDENIDSNSSESKNSDSNKNADNNSETVVPDTGNELPVDPFTKDQ